VKVNRCAGLKVVYWDKKLTFLLATIGYAVGLGNIWLFQYISQNNIGGCYPCIVYY